MAFRRRQLDFFVAVVQEGQMTRAAKRLRVAQPALSQAIAQLEDELGLTLLERHSRGVTPTPAGAALYEKALLAVEASDEAASTARSLARAREGTIEFGFLGAPPSLDSRVEMEEFADAYPEIKIQYKELAFPSSSTAAWMADVDVAVCHCPPADESMWRHLVRREPRFALVPARHPVAGRDQVTAEEIVDETFIGFSPLVDPMWAGFWSLDDYRGGPPERVTDDLAASPQEVLAALAGSSAITLIPAAAATILGSLLTGVKALRLRDAPAARIELVGHADGRNPLVGSLLQFARRTALGPELAGP
ncbi:MAG: LysR family transcriptional regulator [Solirubrobacteraceae bacterium]